jgi:hypothetical protein
MSYEQQAQRGTANDGMFWGAIVRSVLAVVMFFVFNGLGFIFGGYALYYAIRCHQSGNEKGKIAIAVAGLALASVLVGWMFKLSGGRG